MNLLIAVPTFENICPETFRSIYNLERPDGINLYFNFIKGYDCARARNEIGKAIRESDIKYDYVLMVDSDVILPSDTLLKLFETYPKMPAVSFGVVPKKNTHTRKTDYFSLSADGFVEANRFGIGELEQWAKKGVNKIKIKGGAFGCALVNTDLFDLLPYPWFRYVTYANGSFLSEDLYFCDLVNRYELDVVLDVRVRCGHLIREFQYE